MRKADLINQVSEVTGISKIDVLVTIEHTILTIQNSIASGEPLFIRGFGSFIAKKRAAKQGRNIKKGVTVNIPAHYIPQFKPALEFKRKVARLKIPEDIIK